MLNPTERQRLKTFGLALAKLTDELAPDQVLRIMTARISQVISGERARTRLEREATNISRPMDGLKDEQ
jgi:hypothetical protein